jgi:hypothetical protein
MRSLSTIRLHTDRAALPRSISSELPERVGSTSHASPVVSMNLVLCEVSLVALGPSFTFGASAAIC